MPKNYVSPNDNKKVKEKGQGKTKEKAVKKVPKAEKVKAVVKKRKHQEIESSSGGEDGEDDSEDEEGPWGQNHYTRELSVEF